MEGWKEGRHGGRRRGEEGGGVRELEGGEVQMDGYGEEVEKGDREASHSPLQGRGEGRAVQCQAGATTPHGLKAAGCRKGPNACGCATEIGLRPRQETNTAASKCENIAEEQVR